LVGTGRNLMPGGDAGSWIHRVWPGEVRSFDLGGIGLVFGYSFQKRTGLKPTRISSEKEVGVEKTRSFPALQVTVVAFPSTPLFLPLLSRSAQSKEVVAGNPVLP
jgi:hypothetical protein